METSNWHTEKGQGYMLLTYNMELWLPSAERSLNMWRIYHRLREGSEDVAGRATVYGMM